MDPITIDFSTIDFSGLGNISPFVHFLTYLAGTLSAGAVTWKQINATGRCYEGGCPDHNDAQSREEKQQAMRGDTHLTKSIIVGILFVVISIFTLRSGMSVFRDARLNNTNLEIHTQYIDRMNAQKVEFVRRNKKVHDKLAIMKDKWIEAQVEAQECMDQMTAAIPRLERLVGKAENAD